MTFRVRDRIWLDLGAVYAPDDLTQWQQAAITMRALTEFGYMQRRVQAIATGEDWDAPNSDYPPVRRSSLPIQVGAAERALGALVEACNDISLKLCGMAGLQEQCIDSLVEHAQEFVSVVKTMDKSLEGLGKTIDQMTDPSSSELLQTISSIGNGEVSLHPKLKPR